MQVSANLEDKCGVSLHDLPDLPLRDYYEDGVPPDDEDMLEEFLAEVGFTE